MRVTIVTETYYPQVNGVSRTLEQLVRYLHEMGDEVQLVHPDYGVEPKEPGTVLVRAWPLPFYKELRLPLPPFGRVQRQIDAFRPDLIHIATEATLGLSLLGYAKRRGIPVVSSFHTNFDQYSNHYRVGWAKGTIWRYLRLVSQSDFGNVRPFVDHDRRPGIHAGSERLVLWPRGVDSDLFRPDRPGRARIRAELGFKPGDVVVGYVSRMAVEKNVDYLVDAFERVAEVRPQARFLLVGDGPARADLESRMGGRVRFVGYRSGDDLADHYAAADIFAFASVTETFGNVILEAMASGLPVVALRAGGWATSFCPALNGELLDPDQPAERCCRDADRPDRRDRTPIPARGFGPGVRGREELGRGDGAAPRPL